MRKLFVFTLILGVFILTSQLVLAELPNWVTANYSEADYLSLPIQHAGGGDLESIVEDAKKELIQSVFKNADSLFNPRQQQAKNRWVPGSTAAAVRTRV